MKLVIEVNLPLAFHSYDDHLQPKGDLIPFRAKKWFSFEIRSTFVALTWAHKVYEIYWY
jgi:hypothetical protein